MFQYRLCGQNLGVTNVKLGLLIVVIEKITDLQDTYENIKTKCKQEKDNISYQYRRTGEIKAQMAELEKELEKVETLAKWSLAHITELTNICSHIAHESQLYKFQFDELSIWKYILISKKEAGNEVLHK